MEMMISILLSAFWCLWWFLVCTVYVIMSLSHESKLDFESSSWHGRHIGIIHMYGNDTICIHTLRQLTQGLDIRPMIRFPFTVTILFFVPNQNAKARIHIKKQKRDFAAERDIPFRRITHQRTSSTPILKTKIFSLTAIRGIKGIHSKI